MKISASVLFLFAASVLLFSCQRELFFDGVSSGTLKKDATGNCLPVNINGQFKINTPLDNTDFVEVQADVIVPGTFEIRSDTVNGYYFSNSGKADAGTNTIRLYPSGKPIEEGVNFFTARYGRSTCSFSIAVSGTGVAEFTLVGAPGKCTSFSTAGTYTAGTALTQDNTITIKANVTRAGSYILNAGTMNGFAFSAKGNFSATGIQDVTLTGKGIPLKPEVSLITAGDFTSSCTGGITVGAAVFGKAVYSFEGSPGNCTNFFVNGIYRQGSIATQDNTVVLKVNVTNPGTYDIATNSANGIKFVGSGIFTNAGQQTVTLSATGTATTSGVWAYIPNTGTSSCDFPVNFLPAIPPARLTIGGDPGVCTPVIVKGTYNAAVPLNNSNAVVIQVNVSAPGTYVISTNSNNGISFSSSGEFTVTGLQNVTLQGSGTPKAAGTTELTPHYVTSFCSFSIPVQ